MSEVKELTPSIHTKEVLIDMSYHYLETLIKDPIGYLVTKNEYHTLSKVLTLVDELLSEFKFECRNCPFTSNSGKLAVEHQLQYLAHNISGPFGWWCKCGVRMFSHRASIAHTSRVSNWVHRVFRFDLSTLKTSEIIKVKSQRFDDILNVRIKLGMNVYHFCSVVTKLKHLDDLKGVECVSCPNYGMTCDPLYTQEVK